MITQEQIKKTADIIVEKYNPMKILLFGSYSKGTANEDSDVDFFIVKEDVPHIGRERIREIRRKVKLDFACDFFVYKPEEVKELMEMNDPFTTEILTTGTVIYG